MIISVVHFTDTIKAFFMSKICLDKSASRNLNSGYGSYLLLRNGVYYVRIPVPKHLHSLLNRKELRKSLGTGRLKEARPLALRYAVLCREYFVLAEKVLAGMVRMDTETLLQFTDFTEKSSGTIGTFMFLSQEDDFWNDLFLGYFSGKNEDRTAKAVLPQAVYSPVVVNQNVPAKNVQKRRFIVNESQEVQYAASRIVVEKNKKQAELEKEIVPHLSKAVDAFIKAKSLVWTPGSAKEIPPHVKQFTEIITEIEGRDISVAELSRGHIRSYFNVLKYLPSRIIPKLHGNKKWKQLAEMGKQGKFERLLSAKTMHNRQINVRSFINWCELEYKGVIQARYINSGFQKTLEDKQVVRNKNKREGFSQEELEKLFGDMTQYIAETEGSDARFWVPLIALYSGMRVEEICQLYIADIVQIDNIWCFSVNENTENKEHFKHVKSLAGIRYNFLPWIPVVIAVLETVKEHWDD